MLDLNTTLSINKKVELIKDMKKKVIKIDSWTFKRLFEAKKLHGYYQHSDPDFLNT